MKKKKLYRYLAYYHKCKKGGKEPSWQIFDKVEKLLKKYYDR